MGLTAFAATATLASAATATLASTATATLGSAATTTPAGASDASARASGAAGASGLLTAAGRRITPRSSRRLLDVSPSSLRRLGAQGVGVTLRGYAAGRARSLPDIISLLNVISLVNLGGGLTTLLGAPIKATLPAIIRLIADLRVSRGARSATCSSFGTRQLIAATNLTCAAGLFIGDRFVLGPSLAVLAGLFGTRALGRFFRVVQLTQLHVAAPLAV